MVRQSLATFRFVLSSFIFINLTYHSKGYCDGGEYYTEACDWEHGDCDEWYVISVILELIFGSDSNTKSL